MKILIFGAAGMLGHKLYQVLGERFDVCGTIRGGFDTVEEFGIFDRSRLIEQVEVTDFERVKQAIEEAAPDVVINAVGVIKQKPSAKDVLSTLAINSVFPQQLAGLSDRYNFKLICISTDCVFKGDRGGYTEDDIPDALDLYGQSKHWGEAVEGNCLTLRTSIIGHELATSHSLLDWFWSNAGGKVKGFRHAIYSGFPTVTLSRIISGVIEEHSGLRGLFHVSSEPIDKYSLLAMVNARAELGIEIEPEEEFRIDRSLNSDKFQAATGFSPKSWEEMIDEMCSDPTEDGIAGRVGRT